MSSNCSRKVRSEVHVPLVLASSSQHTCTYIYHIRDSIIDAINHFDKFDTILYILGHLKNNTKTSIDKMPAWSENFWLTFLTDTVKTWHGNFVVCYYGFCNTLTHTTHTTLKFYYKNVDILKNFLVILYGKCQTRFSCTLCSDAVFFFIT